VSTISAFPWSELARLDAAAARALTQAAVAVSPAAIDATVAAATSLLGAEVHAHAGRAELVDLAALRDAVDRRSAAVTLDLGAAPSAPRVVVELDGRLGACIVDRALGGQAGPSVPPPTGPLGALGRGVLAYTVARVLAETGAERMLRLREVGCGPEAVAEALGAPSGGRPPPDVDALAAPHALVCWPFDVTVGQDGGTARAWMRRDALVALGARIDPSLGASRDAHMRSATVLGAASVTLTIDAGAARTTRAELAALCPGDVVLLDTCTIERDPQGRIAGCAVMRSAASAGYASPTLRWVAALLPGGDLRVTATHPPEENPMTSGRILPPAEAAEAAPEPDADAPLIDVSTLPVDLVLELGRVTVPVAQLSALAPGAVLQSGLPLGAQVTLRVGDRAVATGELVQVDGEVGVRILRVSA
jgi:type III secretion system YscQ/HrcQ family protein